MYAQAAIKPNTILRNGAYGIVMRGVQKCTRGCSSLWDRKRLPLCCIKLDTATDPACGSGNFLTETYICLRQMENKVLDELYRQQSVIAGYTPIKVKINQFYGIEINDFAVSVAKTALWIAESQTMQKTEQIVGRNLDFLPLTSNATIIEGNSLRLDWATIVPPRDRLYIMGNPPFVGARLMEPSQKDDVLAIFSGVKNNGNLDYVACWYKKAADMMTGTKIRAALVSTNSITQGEQVAILWKYLFEHGVHIDYAYRTFKWDNRGEDKDGRKQKTDRKMAAVHCVIVGFSKAQYLGKRRIFDNGLEKTVSNINGYLVEADDIVIESRKKPICRVPEMIFGNMPNDNKGLLSNYSDEQKNIIVQKFPQSEPLFRKFLGAEEFINHTNRWCLWLTDVSPRILSSIPPVMDAIKGVKEARLKSSREGTRKQANTPMLFGEIRQPNTDYILVPRHSSENRRYIPIGYITPEIICGDANMLIPNATLYHFGVLTSNVHMAWMRTVCGRIKSDYRYSKDIVYNNFPWPSPTLEQKAEIEQTAQMILDARAQHPDCSLADLYDETTMPPELRKAHQQNDKAVMKAYGFSVKMTESECVAELMKMYQKLTEK